ncbi:MAG: hypothetical protein IKE81_03820 [Clostridia bacterium]|nr:hypothetical protein [Clostridia bacterium]
MKVKLIRAARIRHEAGEIVEVSPAEAGFLLSTGSAVRAAEAPAMREIPEGAEEKETPETETPETKTPETAARPKKTTRKKK